MNKPMATYVDTAHGMDQYKMLNESPVDRAHRQACEFQQSLAMMGQAAHSNDYAKLVNAYSPNRLKDEQLKVLLGWENADPSVTRPMLLAAVQNRLNLGRLSVDDIARAA